MSNLTASHKEKKMTNQTPLPLRNDTIFGVCEAIGQDFGFNPLYLRLAFIAPLFFAPVASVAAYLGLGLVVAATRLLVRDRKPAAAPQLASTNSPEVEVEPLPIAA
jgi:phage shock protein PspC (stress-responsive transcriptional regulator)